LRCSLACILVVFLDIQVTPDEFRKAPHSRPKDCDLLLRKE
jgi:hypothetical protein